MKKLMDIDIVDIIPFNKGIIVARKDTLPSGNTKISFFTYDVKLERPTASTRGAYLLNKFGENYEKIAEQLKENWENYKTHGWYSERLKEMTFEDFAQAAEEKIIKMKPYESLMIECGDHLADDGVFECFIHSFVGFGEQVDNKKFSVKFHQSHH